MKSPARKRSKLAGVPASLLASAMRAQGDGVVIFLVKKGAPKFQVVFVNDSFCTMTGRPFEELAAEPRSALQLEKSDLTRLDRWWRTAKPGRCFSGEGYLVRKDASTLYAAWTFSAIFDRQDRATHLVATYRDTTEKRRLQEALVHSQRLDAVGRLAGGVAHDFNNLLSVINGYCEMLAAHLSDLPQALREVNEIHRAGLRAATLTRQLLAFGRRQPMDARVINLNRVVHDNAEIMGRLIGSAGRLELDLAANIGNVRADPTQFQQVLLNLVINARDALRDAGVVTISTCNREIKPGMSRRTSEMPPGRYVCVAVSDNGTGMDADTQKHLFEPFFTTKAEGKGTGLGLALVYGVVQQNNGYIKVRSALLAGSTFEILLPEVREPEETSAQNGPISPLPATRGHETLLLVEEDDVVRKMVAGMLTADGYRALAAKTPHEGMEISRKQDRPVELLIAGCDEHGHELARALHQNSPTLRWLCVGNHEPEPVVWLPAEHSATLAKPFALSEILRSVRALLDT